jgi:hypothetical protein
MSPFSLTAVELARRIANVVHDQSFRRDSWDGLLPEVKKGVLPMTQITSRALGIILLLVVSGPAVNAQSQADGPSGSRAGEVDPKNPVSANEKPLDMTPRDAGGRTGEINTKNPITSSEKPLDMTPHEAGGAPGQINPKNPITANEKPLDMTPIDAAIRAGQAKASKPIGSGISALRVTQSARTGQVNPNNPVTANEKPLDMQPQQGTGGRPGEINPRNPITANDTPLDLKPIDSRGGTSPRPAGPVQQSTGTHAQEGATMRLSQIVGQNAPPPSPTVDCVCDGTITNIGTTTINNQYAVTATVNYSCDGPSNGQGCTAFSLQVKVASGSNNTPLNQTIQLNTLACGGSDTYQLTSDTFAPQLNGTYTITVTLSCGTTTAAVGTQTFIYGSASSTCECAVTVSNLTTTTSNNQITYKGTFALSCAGTNNANNCSFTITYVVQSLSNSSNKPYNVQKGVIVGCGNSNNYSWVSTPQTVPASGYYQIIATVDCGGVSNIGKGTAILNIP